MQKPKRKATNSKHRTTTSTTGLNNICVYCGSGNGSNPAHTIAAKILGTQIARAGMGLVYGGGGLGLMGVVARTTIDNGGRVTGIIPTFLAELECMLRDVDELIVTDDMHQRKQLMFDRSDAFVALPGGIGTLEELVEQLTWSQLGRHKKPVVIANIENYWTPFLELIAHMKSQAFIRDGLNVNFTVVDNANDILPAVIAAHKANIEKPAKAIKAEIIAKM